MRQGPLGRAQKPLKPGNTKKNTKKIARDPPTPGSGPRKYEKNTEKINDFWGPFPYFFPYFCVFSGPDPGWGISCIFLVFFRISGLEGFELKPGTRNHNNLGWFWAISGLKRLWRK